MMASLARRRAPGRRPGSPFFPCCFVGFLLVALVLLLPTSSDACGKPPEFESMRLKSVPKSSYLPGDRIYYECKPGYYYSLILSLNTFCEANSSWSPIDEACFKKECKISDIPNGGAFEPDGGRFEFDKAAHFYCNSGYYLKGEKIITCVRSGNNVHWNSDIPTCEKILCQSPGEIKNGRRTNSWREIFEYNEMVTYSCNPSNGPDPYSLIGESKLICSGPNTWSTNPPVCKVVICENPVLKHGKVISGDRDKFSYQAVVLFECQEGFYLNGSNPVFCGGSSTWEPAMPTCIKGSKPTHPIKPPVSRYPGYPNPREFPSFEDFKDLDPESIVLIVITVLSCIAVIGTCIYKGVFTNKKTVN